MKSGITPTGEQGTRVAPLAGAWIEMFNDFTENAVLLSLPSRERGLKFNFMAGISSMGLSLPSRERGLKFRLYRPTGFPARRSPRGSVD